MSNKYFMDCEFIEDGHTIDLISIGIVCEDGREYYAQSVEFDRHAASRWVLENVFPHLAMCPWTVPNKVLSGTYYIDAELRSHKKGQCVDQHRGLVHNCPWRTREQLKRDIQVFFNPSDGIELWGWCAGYDWVAFCQLFGTMMDVPKGYPHYVHEFQQVLDERGISDEELPKQEDGLHNALADARHLKKLWGYIIRNDCWQ